MHRMLFAVFFVSVLVVAAARAQQSPNDDHGIVPGKAYQSGDLDTINLFNGNLNLSIPLGPSFHVNGILGYGFTLHYGGNPWDFGTHQVLAPQTMLANRPRLPYSYAVPRHGDNAGLGWSLSLGAYYGLGPLSWVQTDPVYRSSDGGEHTFVNGGSLTSDGTYLRRKDALDGLGNVVGTNVEFGNGIVQRFDVAGRLVEIHDQVMSGADPVNWVRIEYLTQGVSDLYPNSPKWHVSDSAGRQHDVYFRPSATYFEGNDDPNFNDPVAHTMIDRIDIAAPNSGRATYQLNYTGVPGSERNISRRCGTDIAVPPIVSASMLTGVSLPNNLGSYAMTYDIGDQVHCSALWDGDTSTFSGNLLTLTTPIGTTTTYAYQGRSYPTPPSPNSNDPAHDLPVRTWSASVKSRVVTAPATRGGGTVEVLSNTTYGAYSGAATLNPTIETAVETQRRDSTNNIISATRHFFCRCAAVALCSNPAEYSLPFTRGYGSGDVPGAFLSTQDLAPDPSTGAMNVIRSHYVRYDQDGQLTAVLPGSTNNARVAYSRTTYEDGKYAEVTSSDYDGLGNYRQTVTGGNSLRAISGRRTRTSMRRR